MPRARGRGSGKPAGGRVAASIPRGRGRGKPAGGCVPAPKARGTKRVVESAPAEEPQPKRRQLARRSSDTQASRWMERKLSHIDPSRIKTLRNKDGLSIKQYVRDEIRKKKVKQGRLSSKFTISLYTEFGLSDAMWFDLDEAPAVDDYDEDLYEKIALCHEENKFERNVRPLIALLARADEFSEPDYLSLLNGIKPGPMLDDLNSQKLRQATLFYIAKHGLHLKYRKHWLVIRQQLDLDFEQAWQSASASGIRAKTFLKTRKAVFDMYCDEEHVQDLVDADGKYSGLGRQMQSLINTCTTAKSLFADSWASCANEIFIVEYKAALRNLEHNDFAEDDLKAYKLQFKKKAHTLKGLVQATHIKWRYTFEVFGQTLDPMDLDDPGDAPIMELRNRLETIAVHSEQVSLFWWESLILPKGSRDDIPMHLKLPRKLLNEMEPIREYVDEATRGCTTIGDVVRNIDKAKQTLKDQDLHYSCVIEYITSHAQKVMKCQVEHMVLNCFPSEGDSDIGPTLAGIRRVLASPALQGLGGDLASEIDGLLDILASLSEGQPPPDSDIVRWAPLTKEAMARATNFCVYERSKTELTKAGKTAAKMLCGAEALQCHFKMVKDKINEDEKSFVVEDLQLLKQFRWMLEENQKVTLSRWMRLALPAHSQHLPYIKDDTPKTTEKKGAPQLALPASTKSTSSAASASGAPSPPNANKASDRGKGTGKGSGQLMSKQALMAKIFPAAYKKARQ